MAVKTKLMGLLEEFQEYRDKFYDKVNEEGFDKKVAGHWWEKISAQASYSFAKAHSLPYSRLAHLTMFLKAYYPKQFYLSLLNNTKRDKKDKNNDSSKLASTIFSAKKDYNIMTLPPDINWSEKEFKMEDGGIRFSFNAIKDVGKAAQDIMDNRPYVTFEEFYIKTKLVKSINKRSTEALIFSGCFDSIDSDRNEILKLYKNKGKKKKKSTQKTFVDLSTLKNDLFDNKEKDIVYNNLQFIQKEIEYLNFSFAEVEESPDYPTLVSVDTTQPKFSFSAFIESIKDRVSKKGNPYCFIRFTDFNANLNVMAFKETRETLLAQSPKKGNHARVSVTQADQGGAYFAESIKISKN